MGSLGLVIVFREMSKNIFMGPNSWGFIHTVFKPIRLM